MVNFSVNLMDFRWDWDYRWEVSKETFCGSFQEIFSGSPGNFIWKFHTKFCTLKTSLWDFSPLADLKQIEICSKKSIYRLY